MSLLKNNYKIYMIINRMVTNLLLIIKKYKKKLIVKINKSIDKKYLKNYIHNIIHNLQIKIYKCL